ncbi:MAG: SurA N-terminal domain-containing protein, partial [Syntrophorhabdaceae bacterium]|nr:SurA N-terminal domain-containing protein [Syntrophorhabdaceae bacterium]
MLTVLRRNAGSWFIKIILSFIALTFIAWGVGSYDEKDQNVAAVVGKEKISMVEFSEAEENLERPYRDMYGPAFTREISKAMDIRKQAINMLIRQRILLAEADKLGIRATDEETQREIAANPVLQINGKFSNEVYRNMLTQRRLSPSQFESMVRTEIIINKLVDVLASGIFTSESEAKHLFLLSIRKIRVLVISGDPAKMKDLPPFSQEEIETKYEQVKETFRRPTRIKLAVADFTSSHFGKEITPSEEEVKEYYEDNFDKFLTEEQRLVSRIVLPYTQQNREEMYEKASRAAAEAAKGTDGFDVLAKKLGFSKPAQTWAAIKDVDRTLANPLFQAPVDTIIGPVDQGNAFVLAHISRIRFPESIPLEQARTHVVEQIQMSKGKDLAIIKVYEAHPKAIASKDIEKTASEYGVKVLKTGWLLEGTPEAPAQLVLDS